MTQLQKHMLSDKKWYDWLMDQVAAAMQVLWAGFRIAKYTI